MRETMATWLVRAGRFGLDEGIALEKGIAIIGWTELPDLTKLEKRESLEELLRV